MSTMMRKQIYLPERQVEAVRERAEALGTSESELIRRAIDAELSGHSILFYPDPDAWKDLRAFLLDYQPDMSRQQPFSFDREEIYSARLDRRHADPD